MAIAEIVERHFAAPHVSLFDVEVGLSSVGHMAILMRDLILHPDGAINTDQVAAVADGMLAYLGQIGRQIDALSAAIAETHRKA